MIPHSGTWLKSDVSSRELFPDNYEVHRCYCKFDDVNCQEMEGRVSDTNDTSYFKENFPEIDFLVCKCFISHLFLLTIIYIPPSLYLDKFDNYFKAFVVWVILRSGIIFG